MSILNSIGHVVGGAAHAVGSIDPTPGFNLGITQTFNKGLAPVTNASNYKAAAQASANNAPASPAPAPAPAQAGFSQPAAPDPYAQYGGKAAFDALVGQFNSQKQGIYGSADEATNAFGSSYGRSILDFLDQERLGQQGIDTKAARNELAKIQGTQGVLGMVGRGVKSGGVLLANRNAGDSSAAQAIANAYGELGRRQLASVGNQYELGNEDVQQAQDAFNVQQQSGLRQLTGGKDDAINKIVSDARNSFAQLDAAMADKSLPQRIAIEQEKESVRQRAISSLQQYDQQLQQGVGGIAPSSVDQRREQAAGLARAGTDLGADAFNYTTQAPADLQNTGPAASDLPLFTLGKRRLA